MTSGVVEVDFIEELRLRRWARENYVPREARSRKWHPIVHEEMAKKDSEVDTPQVTPSYQWSKT